MITKLFLLSFRNSWIVSLNRLLAFDSTRQYSSFCKSWLLFFTLTRFWDSYARSKSWSDAIALPVSQKQGSFCWLGAPEPYGGPAVPIGAEAWAWAAAAASPALSSAGHAWAPLCQEATASDRSRLLLHPCRISVWGSAWFGVPWAQSLCWGFETENRILPFLCVLH